MKLSCTPSEYLEYLKLQNLVLSGKPLKLEDRTKFAKMHKNIIKDVLKQVDESDAKKALENELNNSPTIKFYSK